MAKKKTTKQPPQEPTYPKIADTRLDQLHFTMEDLKVDALVVTFLPNIRYLTNFSGTNATLFVTYNEIHFVTDDRYAEQIEDELYELPNLKTYISRDVWKLLKDKKLIKKNATLAFESDRLSYSDAVSIRNKIRPIKFKPAVNVVERFTMPKAPEELENIQKAGTMAEKVYEKILPMIKPGVSELDLSIEIAHQSRLLGSEGEPFPIIVVSGPRASMVHGKPSEKKIKSGDLVIMDFGCTVNGFVSDITRTVAVGKATKEQKKIYKLLQDAKEAAIEQVRPGMNGMTLDDVARKMIKDAGYGDNFQHSLGHGVGLRVHENPIVTFRMDDQIIPELCVLAIEPGVYVPNKFGIRVEDNVQVTRNGGVHLTNAPKELVVL